MKKTICIVSSCIALAILMVVQCFAISRFDSYSYWSSAQNVIMWNGLNLISNASYSKTSNLTPPTSLQSEFYQNGYYSNNYTLFTDNASGTAGQSATEYEYIADWQYDSQNPTLPTASGFSVSSNSPSYFYLDNGLKITPNSADIARFNISAVSLNHDEAYSAKTRMMLSTTSDGVKSGHSSIVLEWIYNGSYYGASVTCYLNGEIRYKYNNYSWADLGSAGYYSTVIGNWSLDTYHDFEVIAFNDSFAVYLDNQLLGSYDAVPLDSIRTNCPVFVYRRYGVFTVQSLSVYRQKLPTATIFAKLGKSIAVPAGSEIEFYISLRSGSVTNVTQSTTSNFEFTVPDYINVGLDGTYKQTEIQQQDGWLLVNVPSSDSDRMFTDIRFGFITPYVATTAGDVLQFNSVIALSDVIIGDADEIGYNPSVNPEQDKFHNDVINGIGGIKDDLSDIKQEIHDGFDNVSGILGDIESELSRDDTFDDVPAWSDADIENVIPESDSLIQYEQVMANAYQTLEDANIKGAQTWWQNLYTVILTIPMAGMMAVIVSSLLILRALLGR